MDGWIWAECGLFETNVSKRCGDDGGGCDGDYDGVCGNGGRGDGGGDDGGSGGGVGMGDDGDGTCGKGGCLVLAVVVVAVVRGVMAGCDGFVVW